MAVVYSFSVFSLALSLFLQRNLRKKNPRNLRIEVLPRFPALCLWSVRLGCLPAFDRPCRRPAAVGQAWTRNMVSGETGLVEDFDPATGRNVKWVVSLGSETWATPIVAQGRVFIGTNNDPPRDPRHKGDRGAAAVPRREGRQPPVATGRHQARARYLPGLAAGGAVLAADGRGQPRVRDHQSRRGRVPRHRGPAQRQRRPVPGRRPPHDAGRRGAARCHGPRRGHPLAVRHPQPGGDLAARRGPWLDPDRRRFPVRQHQQRRGQHAPGDPPSRRPQPDRAGQEDRPAAGPRQRRHRPADLPLDVVVARDGRRRTAAS